MIDLKKQYVTHTMSNKISKVDTDYFKILVNNKFIFTADDVSHPVLVCVDKSKKSIEILHPSSTYLAPREKTAAEDITRDYLAIITPVYKNNVAWLVGNAPMNYKGRIVMDIYAGIDQEINMSATTNIEEVLSDPQVKNLIFVNRSFSTIPQVFYGYATHEDTRNFILAMEFQGLSYKTGDKVLGLSTDFMAEYINKYLELDLTNTKKIPLQESVNCVRLMSKVSTDKVEALFTMWENSVSVPEPKTLALPPHIDGDLTLLDILTLTGLPADNKKRIIFNNVPELSNARTVLYNGKKLYLLYTEFVPVGVYDFLKSTLLDPEQYMVIPTHEDTLQKIIDYQLSEGKNNVSM